MSHSEDERVAPTRAAVRWKDLAKIAEKAYKASSSSWAGETYGSYNLVRFLDVDGVRLVARVPFRPHLPNLSARIESEVATMMYVEKNTKFSRIAVPSVVAYSSASDGGGVGSPYILMTRLDGAPLSMYWNNMSDGKRRIILEQVVSIMLELSCHRFPKIGSLYRNGQSFTVDRKIPLADLDPGVVQATCSTTFKSGSQYWSAYSQAALRAILDDNFGGYSPMFQYAHFWYASQLIPTLYATAYDAQGFLLLPGDFHSQNILVVDGASPRITGVIDWECSSTVPIATFAQYPLFIVDHPHWDPNDPMRARNRKDQATFLSLMNDTEKRTFKTDTLTQLFSGSQTLYLFEQLIQFPYLYDAIYPELSSRLFRDPDQEGAYYDQQMFESGGKLRAVTAQFEVEEKVLQEAMSVLGNRVHPGMTRREFTKVVQSNKTRFSKNGYVLQWLK